MAIKVSENTAISMPMRNLLAILIAVACGIFAYTEITTRLTSLETSRELFNADLLKKSHLDTINELLRFISLTKEQKHIINLII